MKTDGIYKSGIKDFLFCWNYDIIRMLLRAIFFADSRKNCQQHDLANKVERKILP